MKRYCSIYTRARAFTLVELLIVVAILGILAAVVSSNYISAIARADSAACQQDLRTIHTAFMSYKIDYGSFPPADGLADNVPHPDVTGWGCGPSANGYWSGVSLLLVENGYCAEHALYCPALKRAYKHPIEAYSGCSGSSFAGKEVPQWKFLRYAYNNAATDVGGTDGGEHNIEEEQGNEVWLVRCIHVDVGQFYPDRDIRFPLRIGVDEEDSRYAWYGEFELSLNGSIRQRKVQKVLNR